MRTLEKHKTRLALLVISATFLVSAACSSSTAERPESGTVETEGDAPQTEPAEQSGSTEQAGPPQETTGARTSEPAPAPTASAPVEVQFETIATGLEAPWGLVFLPDGRALVTERDSGRLLSVSPEGSVEEVQQIPEGGSGEGGLLGLALSPDYENDRYIYVYYSTGEDNRVGRFRLGEQPEPILTGIPVNVYHDGGRIAFGSDDMLYVATGDAGVARQFPRLELPLRQDPAHDP